MAKLRPPAESHDRTVMPAELAHIPASVRARFTEEEREQYRAGRAAVDAARYEILRSVTIRPIGASAVEFLHAHGLQYPDRNTPKAAHLTL